MAPARVPDPDACRRLLAEHRVPPHIQRHSERVAWVARWLAEALRRHGAATVDPALVEAAALLHDIAKATCLGTLDNHAVEGGRLLRDLGYEAVAAAVERHVAIGAWDPEGPVTEAEILNYSDKRVLHEDLVGLAERFADLLVRYGGGRPEAERRIRENWAVARGLEAKLFARLPVGPEAVGAPLPTCPPGPCGSRPPTPGSPPGPRGSSSPCRPC